MTSGRINRNVCLSIERRVAGASRSKHTKCRIQLWYIAWSVGSGHRNGDYQRSAGGHEYSGGTDPVWLTSDCLVYGVPQGGNPHFFGPDYFLRQALNPSKRSGPANSERVERSADRIAFFAYIPNALLYLRASDRRQSIAGRSAAKRGSPPTLFRIQFEERGILNTVEGIALRHAVSCRVSVSIARTITHEFDRAIQTATPLSTADKRGITHRREYIKGQPSFGNM